jgi:hypothetical protein
MVKPSFYSKFNLIFLTVLCLSIAAGAKTVIEKSVPAANSETLELESDFGSIEVGATPNATEVKIVITVEGDSKREIAEFLDRFEFDIRKIKQTVLIKGWYTEKPDWFSGNNPRLHYRIIVPEKFNLNLHTSGGSIRVADITGEVTARSSGGSLSFGNIHGNITAKTSGGSIELAGCSGSADVKTSGGSITLGRVDGTIYAKTSGGSIEIDRAGGDIVAKTSGGSIHVNEVYGNIKATTSGGNVTAELHSQPRGDCQLKTSGGNITVYLPTDVSIDIYAKGGQVRCDFPIDGVTDKKLVEGKIRNGGPHLSLQTSGGVVKILQK